MAYIGIEKGKGLRGALYRKIAEKKTEKAEKKASMEAVLPGFKIKSTEHIVEFPSMEDITKIDVTYPLMEPFAYVNIKWATDAKELLYNVIEPELTEEEKTMLKKISSALIELVDVELTVIKKEGKLIEYLEEQIKKVLKESAFVLTPLQYSKIMYYVYRNFVGFNEIEPLLQDPNIEDISCDGMDIPMYIIHRKFGSLKTNIIIEDMEYLREFVIKLSERCGRYVSYAEPILDGTLPDGSRVSATLAGDVATRGPTFTIRKFSEKPLSPIDQMRLKTASSELLAYYWYIVELGASILFVGGVATGKTSFLNTVCMFIPPEAKIVSIEDTRELRIPNDHWVPSLARSGFGIPMPTGEKYGGVSLYDLLKESFRQNPDYVIVGETRGKEAYVMFQGMSSGHPSMSTFHAGSVDTVIKRLITPPIELSPTLIESLNVVTVMIHAKEKGKSARRIQDVVEIEGVDPKTEEVKTNTVFKWDPVADTIHMVNPSIIVEKLVTAKGGTVESAYAEIENRRQILEWMQQNDITDYKEVANIINRYYKEPETLFRDVGMSFKKLVAVKLPRPTKEAVARTAVSLGVPTRPMIPLAPRAIPAAVPKPVIEPTEQEKEEVPQMARAKREELKSILSLLDFKFMKEKESA